MSGDMQMEEKNRTCPSCRCSISVLATKCRFCGETVGKPKVEVRQLSVNDLGGESVRHQAVSSNVIGALDEMRKEAGGSAVSEVGDIGSGANDEDGSVGIGIDPIALEGLDQPTFRPHTPKVHTVSVGDRMVTAVKILAVLAVIAVAAIKGPGLFSSDESTVGGSDSTNTEYVNRAPDILANDGDLLEALSAAMEAKSEAPSAENDKIADEVLALLISEIEGMLNAKSWDISVLKEASSLANKVAELYPSSESTDMKSEVLQEFQDYNMILLDMDVDSGTTTFQLNTRNSPKVTVKQGELVADRFQVVSIENTQVRIRDTKRSNRSLVAEMAQGPR